MRAMQMGDWIEDLHEFAASYVADACQEWRRSQSKKPTIADIRSLCTDRRPNPPQTLIPGATTHDEARAFSEGQVLRYCEAAEANQLFAKQHGFKNFVELLASNFKLPERFPKVGKKTDTDRSAFGQIAASGMAVAHAKVSPERLAELTAKLGYRDEPDPLQTTGTLP